MEESQKDKYVAAITAAVGLAMGNRNEDYNKSGIGLRDYWAVNGIRSPLQMCHMKILRALSQVGTWNNNKPEKAPQVEKLVESMVDLINYAAFTICEAVSLAEEAHIHENPMSMFDEDILHAQIMKGVEEWKKGKIK